MRNVIPGILSILFVLLTAASGFATYNCIMQEGSTPGACCGLGLITLVFFFGTMDFIQTNLNNLKNG